MRKFWARIGSAIFFVLITSAAGAQQSGGLNFAPLADELFNSVKLKGKLAVNLLDTKGSGLTRSAGRAIDDAVRNAIQKKAGDMGLTVVARSGLTTVLAAQQLTSSKELDYAKLASKADVDAIAVISAKKIGGDQVSVTAKLYGVTGVNEGKVLGASGAHTIKVQTKTSVSLEGVFSDGELKPQFASVVASAISSKSGLSLNNNDKADSDFSVKATVEYSISDKETADAQGLKLMSGLIGSLPIGNMGQGNPFAGAAKGMEGMGKLKQISVHVSAEATDIANQSKIASEHSEVKEAPFESSNEQLRSLVQETVRRALKTASDDLATKMAGEVPAKKTKGMLD